MTQPQRAWLALLLAVLLLGVGGTFHLARVRRARHAMQVRGREIAQRLDQPSTRPVLWGDPRPGNAWEDYDRDFELARARALDRDWQSLPDGCAGTLAKVAASRSLQDWWLRGWALVEPRQA